MQRAHVRGRWAARIVGALVLAAGVGATPTVASAAPPKVITEGTPSGVIHKVKTGPITVPRGQHGKAKSAPGAAPPGAAPIACPQPGPNPSCNMTYHNGNLLITNTVHLVYWVPTGFSYQANYQSVIEQYLTDVAADSGRVANPYAVNTQYADKTPANIQYKVTYAGAVTDTAAYPAATTGCNNAGSSTVCLTQKQETDELSKFVKAQGLPFGINDLYMLVLPQKVQTCFDSFSDCGPYGPGTSTNEYCAYHTTAGTSNGNLDWANMPNGADGGCNVVSQAPNNTAADTLIDSLSHEHNEAITNPDGGGWFDVNNSGENGDKCNFSFSPALGTNGPGQSYDVLINHHGYQIQTEWDNSITGCSITYGAVAPTASFTTAPAAPQILDTVTVNGGASKSNDTGGYIINWSWDFGDGSTSTTNASATKTHAYANAGTYTVKLTITDDAGLTATTTRTVTVAKRSTTLTVDGPAKVANGSPATLSGTLRDNHAAAVVGRTVSFTLGSGASAQTCTGVTNASGKASCVIASVNQPAAATSVAVADTFAGDGNYTGSNGSGTASLQYYGGRAYGLGVGLLGFPPALFADTGLITTSVASLTSQSLVAVALPGITTGVINGSVQTGGGQSIAKASTAAAGINLPLVPLISIGAVTATSTSTCTSATGSSTIASLVIGGINIQVNNLPPNSTLNLGVLKVVLNEQLPVPGSSKGLIVNAVHITSPGVLDWVESSAQSDLHNC